MITMTTTPFLDWLNDFVAKHEVDTNHILSPQSLLGTHQMSIRSLIDLMGTEVPEHNQVWIKDKFLLLSDQGADLVPFFEELAEEAVS